MCPSDDLHQPATQFLFLGLFTIPDLGTVPSLILGRDLKPDRLLTEEQAKSMTQVMWEMPLPHGYCPLLLILAPEDVVIQTRPSPADTLSSMLGSLLPDLAVVNASQAPSASRRYRAGGR